MSGRPPRSPSIPIPRNTSFSLPHFDDVIGMPFSNSPPTLPLPRPRAPSGAPRSPSLAGSPPFPRPPSHSFTSSLDSRFPFPARPSAASTTTSTSPVLPRVIRANNSSSGPRPQSSSWVDPTCAPPSTSPSRARRPSSSASARHSSTIRSSLGQGPPVAQSTYSIPPPFPRPAYLDHSSLRHLLQTELPPSLPPSRYAPPPPSVWPYTSRRESSLTPSTDSDDDSNDSPPHHRAPRAGAAREALESVAMVGSSPVFRLPTRWSEQDRHPYLSVSADGRELTYNGSPGGYQGGRGSNPENAALARANYPVPPASGIYYYEIEVLGKSQRVHISIGFTTSGNRLNKLPGWEKNSWGYHGDDGCAFSAAKDGTSYGDPFGGDPRIRGDIIGAGIDFSQNRAFFTKNGNLIGKSYSLSPRILANKNPGMVFEHVAEDVEVYPTVGLRHTSDAVRVNFGHAPFKYDIDDHVQQQRDAVWARIQETRIDWRVLEPGRTAAAASLPATENEDQDRNANVLDENEGREEVGKLILNYLVHHGYAKTARAFEGQLARTRARDLERIDSRPVSPALPVPPPHGPAVGPDSDTPMADSSAPTSTTESSPSSSTQLEHRLAIICAVQSGDIDDAIDGTREKFPDVLEREQGLVLLKLRCRKFVELVNEAAEMKRKVESATAVGVDGEETRKDAEGLAVDEMDGVDGGADAAMEVDDGASVHMSASSNGLAPPPEHKSATEAALRAAITYGQALRADYRKDTRKEVQAHLDKTFGVVAYHFPLEVGGAVSAWAGQEARDALAAEVNQAILESQGWPSRSALERVYRQTAASLVQLGFLGVGAAVFADIQRELLDG
ncbi:hypothetical protein EW146_g483 [Bondarzewia mesenterica]|uniref:B30.2/SPRY domain-containing protein n=1 Tax=Bondarzewia mesenterica TaxID=1095465 RepID=A0A4S4M6X5_9AGAM|nr:hypothetical protein EW146_g483 [Bondarzewia mesenterica]